MENAGTAVLAAEQGTAPWTTKVSPSSDATRVWAISDLHVDGPANREFVEALAQGACRSDVLLFAGDASDRLDNVKWALSLLCRGFGHVAYVPGNHELWLRPADRDRGLPNSLAKLHALLDACEGLGVHVRPFQLAGGGAWIVPLASWHHAGWDREPGMPGASHAWAFSDYSACVWPHDVPGGLTPGSEELAEWFDELNDTSEWEAALSDAGSKDIVSMSHFLPRQELLPEKRFLFFPELPQVSGSEPLARRLARLRPRIHVFGHSHFAWDAELDGTRFIQAPLCTARERARRMQTVRLGLDGAVSDDPTSWLPALVYEAPGPGTDTDAWRRDKASRGWTLLSHGAMPPRYRAAWSEYYDRCLRDPGNTEPAPWIARRQEQRRLRRERALERTGDSA